MFRDVPPGRLHDQVEVVELSLGAAGDDDLLLPAVAELRHDLSNRLVARGIAANRVERRGDIVHGVVDSEVPGQLPAACRARSRGIPFWKEQAEDATRPERADAQRGADRAVDAAGNRHDAAAPAESDDDLAHARLDLLPFLLGVEPECRVE